MESVNIPIGTSFDNKGIVDAQKAFEKFGANVDTVLKQMGSDKTMKGLSDSVEAAFDAGLKGSTALMKRFNQTRIQAYKAMQEVEKLSAAMSKQRAETNKARENMASPDNPDAQQAMKKLMSSSERKTFAQYEEARKASEEENKRYDNFKKENQAALEGLEILKQCAAYREMEKALIKQKTEYEAKYNKMAQAHAQQTAEYFAGHGLKDYKAMFDKNKAFTATGEKSDIYKGYDKLKAQQNKEKWALMDSMPKASEKLEEMRSTFRKFTETYRTQLEKFDKSFGEKGIIEQIRTIQSWLSKLNASRLETDLNGVRKLSADTVNEEQRLKVVSDDLSQEYLMMRNIVKEIFEGHVEETEEVKENKAEEEKTNALMETRLQLIKALIKELENMGNAAQESVDTNTAVPENVNFKDALKQVFSWQRVFTIIGKMVTNLGTKIEDLGHSIARLLLNVGKLGVSMMKVFGSGVVRGITTVGSTIGNIRSRMLGMLPSLKQVSRFLVKYIFGFRTMYFLVRKVRQAVGDGFKAMAKVDPSVNKSISALQMALNQLKGQLGASLAPLLNAIAPVLVKIINLATQATVQIGAFLATLTGQHTFKVAVADNVDYAKSLDKTSKSAGKAAKAIKAYLSPLDELNRMDDPDKGSGGGGAGAGGDDGLAVKYKDVDATKFGISDFARKLKEAWLNQDWEGVGKVISDKLAEVFDNIENALSWKNVEKKVEKITDIVSGIINGISRNTKMWENMGKAVGAGLDTAVRTINRLIGKIDWKSIGSGFATAIGKAIEKIEPEEIAKFLEDKFTVILDLLNGFMDKMKKDGTWTKIAEKIIKALNGADWYGIAVKTFDFAGKIVGAITDVLIGFVTQGGFGEFVDKMISGINDSIGKLTEDDFKKAGKSLSNALVILLKNVAKLLSDTKGSGKKFLEGIKAFFTNINWKAVFENAGDIAASLANGLIEIFATIGTIMNKKGDDGKSISQAIGTKIGEALSKIDFKQLGGAFGDFSEGILEGIAAAFESSNAFEKLGGFILGIFESDSPLLGKLANAALWMSLGGAIIKGIGKAIPLVLSANQATGGKLGQAIVGWLGSKKEALGAGVGALKSGASNVKGVIGQGLGSAKAGLANTGLRVASGLRGIGSITQASITKGGLVPGQSSALGAAGDVAAIGVAIAGVNTAITGCTDAWKLMTGEMKESDFGGIKENVDTFGKAIQNVATDGNQLRLTFALGFQKVGDALSNFFNKTQSLITGVDAFTGEKVPSIKGAFEAIGKKFTEMKNGIVKKFTDLKTNLTTALGNIKTFWTNTWDSIKNKASEVWNSIKGVFAHVGDWFKEKFTTAWENVKNVFSTGGQIFSGIKEGIEKTFKSVVNKIIDGLNKIIKKPFDKLNDIITKLRGIEVLGAQPFKSFKNFDVPQIPKLAQGAVIPASKPFLAMLGDQKSGKNLEAPESLIRQIVREEAGGNNGKTTVVAKVGRRELFEIVLEEAKIRQQTTGRNPFEFT